MKMLYVLIFFLPLNALMIAADQKNLTKGWCKVGGSLDDWEKVLTLDDVKKKILKQNQELTFRASLEGDGFMELVFTHGWGSQRPICFQYDKLTNKLAKNVSKFHWLPE